MGNLRRSTLRCQLSVRLRLPQQRAFERRILFVCRKTRLRARSRYSASIFMPVIMTASGAQAQPLLHRCGDRVVAGPTPKHCTFFLELGNFVGTSKLSVRSGVRYTREQAHERTYLSRRSRRRSSGGSFLLRPSLRPWKCRWKISRQQPEMM